MTEAEHEELTERAREAGVTLALMVRMALGIEGATAEGEGSGDE